MFFEFKPKHFKNIKDFNDVLRVKLMKSNILKIIKEDLNLLVAVYKVRMTTMNEIRNLTLERRLKNQETLYDKANSRFLSSRENDLVLIKRLTQNN